MDTLWVDVDTLVVPIYAHAHDQTVREGQMTNRIDLSELIPKLEEKLGIDKGFLESLFDEDSDWALIIKVHALIEAAISDLLVTVFGKEALNDTFSYLELSNKKTGKMAFVSALNLLDDNCRRYISSLSELRNKLVHNVKNVNFQFHEYVEDMDKQQFNQFVKNFNVLSSKKDDSLLNLFRHDPIQAVWYGAMSVLGQVYLKIEKHL
ncbi:hypothetical protein [Microbulbifer sp.]|uniref:hypothetical protein n=1 Tax=Microbulbifer sp. TaxID=1908541 RepID=UPI002584EFC8|nr:hypothetical protein [Microbulbifer sp.]